MTTKTPCIAALAAATVLAVVSLMPMGCSPRDATAPEPPGPAPIAPPAAVPAASPPAPEPPMPVASPSPQIDPEQSQPSPAPATRPVPPPSPSPTPPPRIPAATPSPSEQPPPAVSPTPTPPPADPQPAADADRLADPGGEINVPATRSGLSRIGAEKCKVCHKLQYASWSEAAHAKRSPPLDCEGCHGAGSEYKSLAVMKDAEKAKAAGLVLPNAAFCATCHRDDWQDGQLPAAHAHKKPAVP